MKNRLKKAGIAFIRGSLQAIYWFMKRRPSDAGRVLFCSRQSDTLPLDFRLLMEELERRGGTTCTAVCCRIHPGAAGWFRFARATLKSMSLMAVSRVCIIDSYWPAVSLLHHKSDLRVIQIWHAIGKLKKSGHAALGKKGGRSAASAQLLRMHANYDYIIAGGEFWNPFYCASFNTTPDKIRNYGLPRIDYLLSTAAGRREEFYREHPDMAERTTILYAPTFRRGMSTRWTELMEHFDPDGYNLIIKTHPNEIIPEEAVKDHVYFFRDVPTIDLLAPSDYVVTDYSSIALEAAVIRRKTLFWVYDYEEYMRDNGLNIDLFKEAPGCVFRDAEGLFACIRRGDADPAVVERWHDRFLPEELGTSTRRICDLVDELLTVTAKDEK